MEVPEFISAIFHGNAANIFGNLLEGKLVSNSTPPAERLFALGYGPACRVRQHLLSGYGKSRVKLGQLAIPRLLSLRL